MYYWGGFWESLCFLLKGTECYGHHAFLIVPASNVSVMLEAASIILQEPENKLEYEQA